MVVLQPAGGGGLSACLRHESRRLAEAAKTIHQCQVSASNPFSCESFRHIPYVDTLHFLRGSQNCFAGVSHNRSLIKINEDNFASVRDAIRRILNFC